MPSSSSPSPQFNRLFRGVPWAWLILIIVVYALLGLLLPQFSVSSFWYVFSCLLAASYGAFARAKWSFLYSTLWWLLLFISSAESLFSLAILYLTQPLSWPPINPLPFKEFVQVLLGLAILLLVKFVITSLTVISRFVLARFISKNQRVYFGFAASSLTLLAGINVGAIASWHWHISEEVYTAQFFSAPVASIAIIITILSLLYTLLQGILFAALTVPIGIAGGKLRKSFRRFHTFLILAATSGLSLGLGWVIHWYSRR